MSILSRMLLKSVGALRRHAWLLVAWSQRHTVTLWSRSISAELKGRRPIDLGRVRRLVSALFKVSSDWRLTNSAGLTMLALVDDEVVADTDPHWPHREVLVSVLGGVEQINGVRFTSGSAL